MNASAITDEICIARQPIVDRGLNLIGYELLFRPAHCGTADTSGDGATSQVLINSFVEIGLENLVAEHLAFVNITQSLLASGRLTEIPSKQLVLEILEDVVPDEVVVEAVARLSDRGYRIALDDFIYRPELDPLIRIADIIKFDVLQTPAGEVAGLITKLREINPRLVFLAEKVETHEEFERFAALGIEHFQGYFFARPRVLTGKTIKSNQAVVLDLLARVHEPDITADALASLISSDVSLCHKMLRYINSPATGLRQEISSIQQAVVLLGLSTIQNWVTLLAMSDLHGKPPVLLNTALVRARCCELLARAAGLETPESYFMVGLLSVVDGLLDQPMEQVLEQLPLPEGFKLALLTGQGTQGEALRCVMTAERDTDETLRFQDLEPAEVSRSLVDAIHWSYEHTPLH